jgi:hypothetical protein
MLHFAEKAEFLRANYEQITSKLSQSVSHTCPSVRRKRLAVGEDASPACNAPTLAETDTGRHIQIKHPASV